METSPITPSNIIDGQLAFAADLPGFEVRPLNLSQLLSTDGVMFDVTNLQKLTEFGEDVGKDVSVESVASQFKHSTVVSLQLGLALMWIGVFTSDFLQLFKQGELFQVQNVCTRLQYKVW